MCDLVPAETASLHGATVDADAEGKAVTGEYIHLSDDPMI